MVLNLHFRGGIEPEGFEVLKSYNVKRAIFHWYSGTLELLDEINDEGYYYSIGQINLAKRQEGMKERITDMVRKIPDDRLLLEIDVLPKGMEKVPSVVFRGILEDMCSCQAKKYPFDNRKQTHLGCFACTLTIEKVPI
jgi:hypothetical protein